MKVRSKDHEQRLEIELRYDKAVDLGRIEKAFRAARRRYAKRSAILPRTVSEKSAASWPSALAGSEFDIDESAIAFAPEGEGVASKLPRKAFLAWSQAFQRYERDGIGEGFVLDWDAGFWLLRGGVAERLRLEAAVAHGVTTVRARCGAVRARTTEGESCGGKRAAPSYDLIAG